MACPNWGAAPLQAQSQPHNWANEFLQYDETTAAAAPPAQMSAEQRELQRVSRQCGIRFG